MLQVKRPTAIVFGWDKPFGKYEFITDVFSKNESLMGWVDLYALRPFNSVSELHILISEYKADLIVIIGDCPIEFRNNPYLERIFLTYDQSPKNIDLANDVVSKITFNHCSPYFPTFSIFTPAFKTGERIYRTYESLVKQTFSDWEWVVVDDSPEEHNELWESLCKISFADHRVKPFRITPNSNGRVGFVKNRACSLSNGVWLVELDHDDELVENCLEVLLQASNAYPDAGFMYSDCTEIESNGNFRKYDDRVDWDFYGAKDNYYNFGYSGHSWAQFGDRKFLQHHSPSINPVTIRFNVSMPNHVRAWRKDVYQKIGGHSKTLPLADDFELIIKSFLETRIVHIRRVLYIQHNNGRSTVDYNSFEINRLSRIIKDVYNERIHQRIVELDFHDWEWDDSLNTSKHPEAWVNSDLSDIKFGDEEQVMNYIFE